jgi:uncharacterized protein YegL
MKKGYAAIGVIIDKSGSMSGLVNDTIGGFNQLLKEQKEAPGEADLTLTLFDSKVDCKEPKKLSEVQELTNKTYVPGGSTSLLDAIGTTITKMGKRFADMQEDERPEKVLIAIITDGEENTSTEFSNDKIREMIKEQTEKYSWEFQYFGANQDSFSVGGSLGLSTGSCANYVSNSIGTRSAYKDMSKSLLKSRA